jgi:hypothetical protein
MDLFLILFQNLIFFSRNSHLFSTINLYSTLSYLLFHILFCFSALRSKSIWSRFCFSDQDQDPLRDFKSASLSSSINKPSSNLSLRAFLSRFKNQDRCFSDQRFRYCSSHFSSLPPNKSPLHLAVRQFLLLDKKSKLLLLRHFLIVSSLCAIASSRVCNSQSRSSRLLPIQVSAQVRWFLLPIRVTVEKISPSNCELPVHPWPSISPRQNFTSVRSYVCFSNQHQAGRQSHHSRARASVARVGDIRLQSVQQHSARVPSLYPLCTNLDALHQICHLSSVAALIVVASAICHTSVVEKLTKAHRSGDGCTQKRKRNFDFQMRFTKKNEEQISSTSFGSGCQFTGCGYFLPEPSLFLWCGFWLKRLWCNFFYFEFWTYCFWSMLIHFVFKSFWADSSIRSLMIFNAYQNSHIRSTYFCSYNLKSQSIYIPPFSHFKVQSRINMSSIFFSIYKMNSISSHWAKESMSQWAKELKKSLFFIFLLFQEDSNELQWTILSQKSSSLFLSFFFLFGDSKNNLAI